MKGRIKYLDLLRIVAISMVVMLHTGAYYQSTELAATTTLLSFLTALSSCAVPLFFMISGALLLSPEYDLSVRRIVVKLIKLFIVWTVWSAVYALIDNPGAGFHTLVVRTFKGPFHFWFFEYLAAVYLLSPLMKALVSYQNGKFVKYILICWFALGIIKYTLNGIQWHNEELNVLTGKVHFELAGFSGYFLLGYFLSNLKLGSSSSCLAWALAYLSAAALQMLAERSGMLQVPTYNLTVLVAIESFCAFIACRSAWPQNSAPSGRWLVPLAVSGMGVYIIHPIIMKYVAGYIGKGLPVSLRSLLLFAIVLLASWGISLLLSKIPFIRKWLLSI